MGCSLNKTGKSLKGIVKRQSSLEAYLDYVYEKECLYKIEKEEVWFIQTGIEHFVASIADVLLKDEHVKELMKLRDDVRCQPKIIKVGSFYEDTKNNFPDEFDFIVLLCCTERESLPKDIGTITPLFRLLHLINKNREVLQRVLLHKSNKGDRKLCFNGKVERNGPAATLEFDYINDYAEKRHIHVDVVPAVRIIDSKLEETVRQTCKLDPFGPYIISTGSYLFVNNTVSFTETEVTFMKTVLSKSHVKVYRLLKYLINGHCDGKELEEYLKVSGPYKYCIYSSYKIKTAMIYHHFCCRNTDLTKLGPCILQVLDDMCLHEDDSTFPELKYVATRHELFFVSHLRSMRDTLRAMQKSDFNTNELEKLNTSVSRRYLEYGRVKSTRS